MGIPILRTADTCAAATGATGVLCVVIMWEHRWGSTHHAAHTDNYITFFFYLFTLKRYFYCCQAQLQLAIWLEIELS